MKLKSILKAFMLSAALAGVVVSSVSCDKQTNPGEEVTYGNIFGVVKDTQGELLSGVEVSVKGLDVAAVTGNDGKYVLDNVPVATQLVTFSKQGYATVGMTVPANRFIDGTAELNPVLEFANARIMGLVLDAQNGDIPFEGVSVSIGNNSMVTGVDGKYLFEDLTISDYTLTLSKSGCTTITKNLTADMFVDGIIEVETISMGGTELLPGLTAQDLKSAGKWFVNEYRGGYGRGGGRVDWSTVFMSASFGFYGNWEMQNEGCTLRIVEDNPVSTEMFDTYAYGIKSITEDNRILTVYVRTHQASISDPAVWGLQVIDLDAAEPKAVKVGEDKNHGDGSYSAYTFDLGAYVGKEVVLAIGIYHDANDTFKQLCVAHVSFAAEETPGDEYLPGIEVAGLEGWHMTQGHVRSMMPNPRKSFTGLPGAGENIQSKSNPAYHGWYGTGHIASEWGFMYVNKDVEPLASEGFVIKTRSGASADYDLPESYFYSKFAISAGTNVLTLTARNFDGNTPTVFKVTAIDEDCNVTFLDPSSNTAAEASKVDGGNGCWQFINNDGGAGSPEKYASFEYDLSQFNGKNVVITIGVHKGETSDGEQKLCIYGVSLK